MSFEEHKFFILTKSSLSGFSFMDCAFDVTSKKSLSNARSQRFSPMFGSRACVVSAVTFRSVIYLELVFDYV